MAKTRAGRLIDAFVYDSGVLPVTVMLSRCNLALLLVLILTIIGASLSEPHIDRECVLLAWKLCMYVYILHGVRLSPPMFPRIRKHLLRSVRHARGPFQQPHYCTWRVRVYLCLVLSNNRVHSQLVAGCFISLHGYSVRQPHVHEKMRVRCKLKATHCSEQCVWLALINQELCHCMCALALCLLCFRAM